MRPSARSHSTSSRVSPGGSGAGGEPAEQGKGPNVLAEVTFCSQAKEATVRRDAVEQLRENVQANNGQLLVGNLKRLFQVTWHQGLCVACCEGGAAGYWGDCEASREGALSEGSAQDRTADLPGLHGRSFRTVCSTPRRRCRHKRCSYSPPTPLLPRRHQTLAAMSPRSISRARLFRSSGRTSILTSHASYRAW